MDADRTISGRRLDAEGLERDLKTVRRVGLRDTGRHTLADLRAETARVLGLGGPEVVNRVHLETLLRRAIAEFEGGELSEASTILFGLSGNLRGHRPPELRRLATALFYSDASPRDVDAFRKRYEDNRIMPELASIIAELPNGVTRAKSGKPSADETDDLTISPEGGHQPPPSNLSPLARALWIQQSADCQAYLTGLRIGHVIVETRDRLLEYLIMMCRMAQTELVAVDFIDILRWFGERDLAEYLDVQLSRVRRQEVRLTRLRFVAEDELQDGDKMEALRRFVALHDDAGAVLELCSYREPHLSDRGLFFPRTGALFVDPTDSSAFLAARLNEEGLIVKGDLYVGNAPEIPKYLRDFEAMLDTVRRRELTEVVRSRLSRTETS